MCTSRSMQPAVIVTIFMVVVVAMANDRMDENWGPDRPVRNTYMLL